MLDRIKRRLNDASIKTRLLLTLLIVSLASMCLITAYSYDMEYDSYLQKSEKHLVTTAQGVRRAIPRGYYSDVEEDPSRSPEVERVSTALNNLATEAKVDHILVVAQRDGKFRVVASDDPDFKIWGIYDVKPDALQALQAAFDTRKRQSVAIPEGMFGDRTFYFYPIWRGQGDSPAVVIVEMANAKFRTALRMQLMLRVTIGLLAFVLIFGFQLTLVNGLVKPIDDFSEFSERLANNGFKLTQEERHHLSSLAARRDEVGKLARSLMFMEARLGEFITELAQTSAERQKVEAELALARDMQLRMVPKELPPMPSHKEIDIHAVLMPAKAVGGDLYDFFMLDEHRLFFQIGDVADKGIHAALYMGVVKAILKGAFLVGFGSLSETLRNVNKFLTRNNNSQVFVTMFTGILDLRTGLVQYADAGHEVPLVLRKSGEVEVIRKQIGLPIAIEEDFPYDMYTLQLDPGDCLLLYTDGVREGMNAGREQFSRGRMVECLRSVGAHALPRDIIECLLVHLKDFVQEAPQSDDIAVLAIRYLGSTDGVAKARVEAASTVAGASIAA